MGQGERDREQRAEARVGYLHCHEQCRRALRVLFELILVPLLELGDPLAVPDREQHQDHHHDHADQRAKPRRPDFAQYAASRLQMVLGAARGA